MNINNVRTPLYEASRIHGMIEPLKELRKNVKASRGEIKGSFNGILTALGAEMDRRNGKINDMNNKITGPIACDEAKKTILFKNIENICFEVDSSKNYCGMLRELAKEMTANHGIFGEN